MNFVFDLDDTLYDLRGPFEKAYEKFLDGRIEVSCAELFLKSRIYSEIVLRQEKDGIVPPEDAFYERMRLTCQDVGYLLTREEGRQFEAEYRDHQAKIQLFGFAKDVLEECIKNGRGLAVLTNGNRKAQQRKIDALGLNNWIDSDRIFISGEIGYQKPDAEAFKYIEKQLHFLPEETWYVGDTYEVDVVGADGAGWHTIWLNHRKRSCPEAVCRADKEITQGEQLLSLIQSIW